MSIREKYNKYKWRIHGTLISILVLIFLGSAFFFVNEPWIGHVLQAVGTIIGMYFTLIIFLFSKEESDKQFLEQLQHLQNQTNSQIEAIEKSNQRSIEVQEESIIKQIKAIQHSTESYLKAMQESTDKQINQLEENTNKQISSFEVNIQEVANNLNDNAVLLGEILSRELEKAMKEYEGYFKETNKYYRKRQGFQFFRSPQEKSEELNRINQRAQWLKNKLNDLISMYNGLRDYLGSGSHRKLIE